MPTYQVFVYSADDFAEGLPAESGAAAAGRGPFKLTLKPDAEPTLIEIWDDDLIFDEVDRSQAISSDVAFDGLKVASGTSINSAYDLINSDDGHKITSFHFGGSGYQQGEVDGVVSTVKLPPGETFTFDIERTSHRQANAYDDYIACFVRGTRIKTPSGEVAIEHLRAGDLVSTYRNGPRPLVWAGYRVCDGRGPRAPIALPEGWNGLTRKTFVSRQHRMLLTGPLCDLLVDAPCAFVSAAHLLEAGLGEVAPQRTTIYHHLLFDGHEAVRANGAWSESLLRTEESSAAFGLITPETNTAPKPAFPILSGHDARYVAASSLGHQHPQTLSDICTHGQP